MRKGMIMRKFTLGVLSAFAILGTGCCLRVMDTRVGVNCCGVKDAETFTTNETTATAVATDPAAPVASNDNALIGAIAVGVGIAALIGWNAYNAIQKKKAKAVVISETTDK